jgi:hypothetical protein
VQVWSKQLKLKGHFRTTSWCLEDDITMVFKYGARILIGLNCLRMVRRMNMVMNIPNPYTAGDLMVNKSYLIPQDSPFFICLFVIHIFYSFILSL